MDLHDVFKPAYDVACGELAYNKWGALTSVRTEFRISIERDDAFVMAFLDPIESDTIPVAVFRGKKGNGTLVDGTQLNGYIDWKLAE